MRGRATLVALAACCFASSAAQAAEFLSVAERTAVLQGISAGERVVIRGVDHLREGVKVQVEGQQTQGASSGKAP